MIDIHTHPCQMRDKEAFEHFERHQQVLPRVAEAYLRAIDGMDKAIVLAFIAPQSDIVHTNEFAAAIVDLDPNRIVGFASVDPGDKNAGAQLQSAVDSLGLKGVKLGPIYQHFDPWADELWPLYEQIMEMGLPILWHQGTSFMAPEGPLELARPVMLDKIARRYPEMRMVIAHYGYPWAGDVTALLGRHQHVYADLSILAGRQWYLYESIRGAIEYGVENKLLLGSDYPAFTGLESAQALRELPGFAERASLPAIPEAVIEAILVRDSLALLGVR
jgi:predicted TIM-barrel fold metal-dependent hydrolase